VELFNFLHIPDIFIGNIFTGTHYKENENYTQNKTIPPLNWMMCSIQTFRKNSSVFKKVKDK